MPKVCVLVPFAFDETGLANRRIQQQSVVLGPDMDLHFKPIKAGPELYDSYHDFVLADMGMLEAGIEAAQEGFDAICIDTMSDSGANALRSVVDIPVVAPGKASYLMALMLGHKFSVLTQWDPWLAVYRKGLQEYGLTHLCASLRSINMPPDVENLLGGEEDVVFPRLIDEGMRCIEDGADVICLGSPTLHQAHGHLSERLPVPVINPGPLTYKLAEAMLGLGLTHSRSAYPRPHVELLNVVQAMVAAGAQAKGRSGN